jgi:ribosomal protein L12E/L44/L45/RPP1/RPP2
MTLESMTLDPTTLLATYARNPASGIGEIVSIYSALAIAAASSARGVPRNDEDDEEEEDDDKKHGDDEEEDDDGEGYSE